MSTEVTLPALGESVTEGTVSRWLKAVGDSVAADEPLLEVSTDKVDTEIPSPAAGTLLEIRADEDETIEVGAVLAVIGDASESDGDSDTDDADSDSDTPDPDSSAQSGGSDQAKEADEDEATEDTSAADEGREPDQASSSNSSDGSNSSSDSGESATGTEIKLPELGESVTEGTVSRWLKAVGDSIEVDEALLEVSTDKVDTEIPSPVAGTLLEIRVSEDETVEVGSVLAVVGDDSAAADESDSPAEPEPESKPEPETKPEPEPESKPQPAKAEDRTDEKAKPAPAVAPRSQGGSSQSGSGDGYVTPLVRKLAAEHDVELSSLEGTGVGGRIRKQDVLAAAEAANAPAPEPEQPAASTAPAASSKSSASTAQPSALRGTTVKMSRLRKTIAKRMVESLQVSAQLTATVEVDLTTISRIRAQAKDDFKAREGASLSYLPFITKAVVESLKVFPNVNATLDGESISYPDAEHVGIAVDTEKGLLVPVIKDAGDLNIAGLAKKIADLAARTRSNKIGPDELGGGTFTITNYGSAGTLMDTPIINQPQVAILGTGALVKRPMVIKDPRLGEVIAIRDMMYLSMSYDHRIVDGADAARFLSAVKARLEEGDFGSEFGL